MIHCVLCYQAGCWEQAYSSVCGQAVCRPHFQAALDHEEMLAVVCDG